MGDSSLTIRNVSGSLVSEPEFVGVVSVQYTGTGDIIAAEEIPTDGKTLKSLYVENQGTLNLSKNTLVNDSLIIKANIITGNDTLELKSRNNPLFDFANFNLEIQGNFKRSAVIPGDSIILNNPWTWVRFGSTADLGQIKAITSTILPSQFQPYFEGTEKVKRLINLSVYNESGSSLNTGFKGQFGYSWRHNPGNLNDESNGLNPEELVLQRWDGNGWLNLPSSIPITDYPLAWSYANTDSFDTAGFFAIGNANISGLMFRAFALLEGPYIPNSQKYMTTELWKRNLIRNADINAYPLNLITDIASMLPKTIPDSVVDFAVLEFRKDRNGDAIFRKPIFFKYDGRLVDLFGSERIKINDTSAINVAGGDYYVVIRHRNHAPVITQEPLRIIKENNTLVYNFNDPKLIEGGTTTLKLVDYVDNKRIYAIKGGFIPYSNADIVNMMNITMYYTNPVFWEESWKKFTNIGYINTDYNLSGIVNTKDFNISWNNRGK